MFAAAKAMFTFTPTDFILNNSQLWLIRGLSEVSDMLDSSQSNVDRWRHHVHKLELIYVITFSFLEGATLRMENVPVSIYESKKCSTCRPTLCGSQVIPDATLCLDRVYGVFDEMIMVNLSNLLE